MRGRHYGEKPDDEPFGTVDSVDALLSGGRRTAGTGRGQSA